MTDRNRLVKKTTMTFTGGKTKDDLLSESEDKNSVN